MIKPRYAILLDGGFIIKKLQTKNKVFPSDQDIVGFCKGLKQDDALKDCDLLRIYFYHAQPAAQKIRNPLTRVEKDLSQSPVNAQHSSLIDRLELQPDFAVRLGETMVAGWKIGSKATKRLIKYPRPLNASDIVPNISQKGVDLRIGLDIARLSLRQMVQIIVVVTGDSDLVPAFKFARREGVRIYLHHMGHGVKRDLKAHADLILR